MVNNTIIILYMGSVDYLTYHGENFIMYANIKSVYLKAT